MAIDYSKKKPEEPKPATGLVSLTKSAPIVSLTKQESEGGILRVNLNWSAGRPRGLFRKGGGIDLDLGCLYEYADGSTGCVQALGNAFTDRHTYGGEPIVRLDGDDRSGNVSAGENLFVDLTEPSRIVRILVFALIYEGAANWSAADGVVTVHPASGRTFDVRLEGGDPRSRMCGIAMIANTKGAISIRREVTYVGNHSDLDRRYGWGLRWAPGRK